MRVLSPSDAIFHSCIGGGKHFFPNFFFFFLYFHALGVACVSTLFRQSEMNRTQVKRTEMKWKTCPTVEWVSLLNIEWEALIALHSQHYCQIAKCESAWPTQSYGKNYLCMWQEEEEVPKVVNVKVKLGRKERRISRKLSALNLAPWGSKRKLNMLSNQRRSQCQHTILRFSHLSSRVWMQLSLQICICQILISFKHMKSNVWESSCCDCSRRSFKPAICAPWLEMVII